MIVLMDESDVERNISGALVYLDCARANLEMENEGRNNYFAVIPQMVARTIYDE